jgi:GNAT superfamily N-acetyltransferase
VTLPAWHEEPIARSHRRQEFDCGDPDMNQFLQRYARQSHEQNAAKTFCAIDDNDSDRVLGFYTIAPSAVDHNEVPVAMTRGLGRHEGAGFKLARIATDVSVAGQGLGGQLLAAAALRCLRVAEEAGGILLIIDAKHERAANWYASYGAEPLHNHPLTLVMPLETFAADLRARGLL